MWDKNLHFNVVMQVGAVHQLLGLRKKSSGVQGEDTRFRVDMQYHVGQNLILNAQAGGEGDTGAVNLQEMQ